MQCCALNIKTGAKVWLYFVRRTTQPGYAGFSMNLKIVSNILKNPLLNQATQKYLSNFPNPKNPRIKNFRPKKSFDLLRHLKSVLPLGSLNSNP